MRVTGFTFDGYPGGDIDFAGRFAAADPAVRDSFVAMVGTTARALLADAATQPYVAITVIGHSDRQDRPGMTHAQAQASEAAAAQSRAVDAWTWLRERITWEAGLPDELWTEESPKVTWAMVFAGSGQMVVPEPVQESDRLRNRRVVVLFGHFED